jgi:hypothetical protein
MPFPPAFTDAWDITQPPDTQQANLLGQDLRNLKLDIMQRMSLLSGTTANMPTPETVNATWGGAGYGLIFLATDTGIIWQWNGALWVNISSSFSSPLKLADTSINAFTNPNANQIGNTVTIPANTLAIGSVVNFRARIYTTGAFSATGGFPTVGIIVPGAILATLVIDTGSTLYHDLNGSFAITATPNARGIMTDILSTTGVVTVEQLDGAALVLANPYNIQTFYQANGSTATGTVTFDFLEAVVIR